MFSRIISSASNCRIHQVRSDAAAAVQELLGGRFGEMSTLNNYLHQSVA